MSYDSCTPVQVGGTEKDQNNIFVVMNRTREENERERALQKVGRKEFLLDRVRIEFLLMCVMLM